MNFKTWLEENNKVVPPIKVYNKENKLERAGQINTKIFVKNYWSL